MNMPDEYDSDHLFWAASQKVTDLFARVDADLWAENGIWRGLIAMEKADPDCPDLYRVLKDDSRKRERLLITIKERLVEARPSLMIEAWQSLLSGGTVHKREELLD